MMDISTLPSELIIHLAEQLDVASLIQLMLTNKRLRKLILLYERSICKSKLSRLAFLSRDGQRNKHSHFNVLSSASVEREAYQSLSFPGILELELRERRIEEILGSGYIDLASPPGLQPLTPVQQLRFVNILRRSLHHCDAIADVAANVVDLELPDYDYTNVSSGVWNLVSGLDLEVRHRDPFANVEARSAQIAYLGALPVEDLAGIYLTIMAVSSGHIRDRPALQGDPNFAERITVFEECTLRHGTWFLWAQVIEGSKHNGKNDLTLREMTGHMLLAGFAELIGWETGDELLPPGLRMSLFVAAKRFVEEEEDRPVVFKLYDVLRKLIFGNCEDR